MKNKLTEIQENLYMAIGRAYVHPKNVDKEMDSDLSDAIVAEMEIELKRLNDDK